MDAKVPIVMAMVKGPSREDAERAAKDWSKSGAPADPEKALENLTSRHLETCKAAKALIAIFPDGTEVGNGIPQKISDAEVPGA